MLETSLKTRGIVMSADTMSAVFDLMEPQGIISEEVLFALDQLFGERLIGEFAAINVRMLATEISVRRSALIPQSITSIDLAKELLDTLRKLEYISSAPETAQVPPPAAAKQSQQKDDEWYRSQLEAIGRREVNVMSSDVTIDREVAWRVKTMSGDVHLKDAIILYGLSTMSGDISGKAYATPQMDVSSMSGNVSVRIQRLPWPKLYDKAVKLGLLEV